MQTENKKLIDELLAIANKAIEAANRFKSLSKNELNFKESENKWSIPECIEHLNLYGDFYLPEFEKQLLSANLTEQNGIFKSGFLGNYFANLMRADNGKMKKMKSPKDKNPLNSDLSPLTIDRFIKQVEKLKHLLQQSITADLTNIKVPTSLSKFIRLRLGDTFRFFVYHIERHIAQANRNVTLLEAAHAEQMQLLNADKQFLNASHL